MLYTRTAFHPTVALVLAMTFGAGTIQAQPAGPLPSDPPGRVGRMALLLGTVSFRSTDQSAWDRVTQNYPLTSGNALWTEPSSAAEIEVGQTHIALDQSTEFDVTVLDDHVMQASVPQGALFLRLRRVPDGDLYQITTPRGVVTITRAGAYEIVAGDADRPTLITVVEGAARIDSPNASLTVQAQQTGRIDGSTGFAASVGPPISDPFLTARLAQERQARRPALAASLAPPQVVAEMTGGDALYRTGSWAPSPTYGRIWYPPVRADWVPYREGHWGYVAPWGWTWIDDAPWGFAPFHYGRWVQDGPRWGWIPVEQGARERTWERPVYAPALVSFVGLGIAVGIALSPGREERGSVGWIPLGPSETYVPPYRTSDRYMRDVNVSNVTNVNNITTVTNVSNTNNYINRSAATVVPAAAMTGSQPIAARVETVTPQALAAARPQRTVPVQPTQATIGVTPAVVKQLQLAPAATPVPQRVGPGPVVPPPTAATPIMVRPTVAKGGPATKSDKPIPIATAPVALPVLRPVTPTAPAHPQAGGTIAGTAAPVTTGAVPQVAPPKAGPVLTTPGMTSPTLGSPAAPAPPAKPAQPGQSSAPPVGPSAPSLGAKPPIVAPGPTAPAHGLAVPPQAPPSAKPNLVAPGIAAPHPAPSAIPAQPGPSSPPPAGPSAPSLGGKPPIVAPGPTTPAHGLAVPPPAPAAAKPNQPAPSIAIPHPAAPAIPLQPGQSSAQKGGPTAASPSARPPIVAPGPTQPAHGAPVPPVAPAAAMPHQPAPAIAAPPATIAHPPAVKPVPQHEEPAPKPAPPVVSHPAAPPPSQHPVAPANPAVTHPPRPTPVPEPEKPAKPADKPNG
jgi:hypothetical protein